jgi:hypothetical protein
MLSAFMCGNKHKMLRFNIIHFFTMFLKCHTRRLASRRGCINVKANQTPYVVVLEKQERQEKEKAGFFGRRRGRG